MEKPIDPYRTAERAIMIVIVSIITIHVHILIITIPIKRVASMFVDGVHPIHTHSRNHDMCQIGFFSPQKLL